MKRERWLNAATYSFIFGAIGVLAFAPFNLYPLMILSLAGLAWVFHGSRKQQVFRYGWYYGLAFFGCGVSWVYVSIHSFGGAAIALSALLTVCFIAILALIPGSVGALLNHFYPKNTSMKLWLAFPALWTLMEWVRSWLFSGFPWLLAGSSQLYWPLNHLAPVIGTYGISFILAQCAGALIYALYGSHRQRYYVVCYAVMLALICTALGQVSWTKPQPASIRVNLVQGNIPPSIKWQAENEEHALQHYITLSAGHWDNQLVIWPEAAITTPLPYSSLEFNAVYQYAHQHHGGFITGIPYAGVHPHETYNAAIATSAASGLYFKHHLVPFGEYFPVPGISRHFLGWLHIPMSSFTAGSSEQQPLHYQRAYLATFLCYEIIFPEEVRAAALTSNILLNLSDDAWFGHSFAQAQHLQMMQMRALETGRYVLSVTNTGVTAIISNTGKIVRRLPANESDVLSATVPLYQGNTPWMKYGSNLYLSLCLLSLLIAKIREKKLPLVT